MKNKYKKYLRINIMPVIFIVVSLISVTFAWFAYTGLSNVNTEIGVKSWHIELDKNGKKVSNDIVISLDNIYPGMETVHELINIKNLGDSDATLKYSIISARLLDKEENNFLIDDNTITSEYVEDLLSHNYPFHINMNLSKNYILAKNDQSSFEVSISWPLDSGNNNSDSIWGSDAYNFKKHENEQKTADSNYEIRSSLQIVISVTAEQYIENDIASDPNYNLGEEILFDVVNNQICQEISNTCIKTYVIDINNKLEDEKVTLLPDPTSNYLTSNYENYNSTMLNLTNGWEVNKRPLTVNDILKIVSKDITNSLLVRDNISDSLIGNLNYNDRINTEITKAINSNGYYKFINEKFTYLLSDTCYWINTGYNNEKVFSYEKIDNVNSKIFGNSKTSLCKVIPVIEYIK